MIYVLGSDVLLPCALLILFFYGHCRVRSQSFLRLGRASFIWAPALDGCLVRAGSLVIVETCNTVGGWGSGHDTPQLLGREAVLAWQEKSLTSLDKARPGKRIGGMKDHVPGVSV